MSHFHGRFGGLAPLLVIAHLTLLIAPQVTRAERDAIRMSATPDRADVKPGAKSEADVSIEREQRRLEREAGKLVQQFRRSRRDLAMRRQLLAQIIRIGHEKSIREADDIVLAEMAPAFDAYSQAFASGAARLAAGASIPIEQIHADRAVLQNLLDDKALTKDRIVAEGDPAIDRLAQRLLVDRQAVFAADDSLLQQRKQLFEQSLFWTWLRRAEAQRDGSRDAGSQPPVSFEMLVEAREELALLAAVPGLSAADRAALDRVGASLLRLPPGEAVGILLTNRLRILAGKSPFAVDEGLVLAARAHSRDMMEHGFFSHTSPLPGKKSIKDRAQLAGTRGGGENIYRGGKRPDAPIQAWFRSPGHFKNLLGRYQRVGLGQFGSHWTMMFG